MPVPALRFAFSGSGIATYPAGTTFGPRTNGNYELVWIISGDTVWDIGSGPIEAPPGTILLARPGMRDRFVWDPRRPTRHGYVHFEIVSGNAGLPPPASWPLARMLPEDDVLRPLLRHLGWLFRRGDPPALVQAQEVLGLVLTAFISGLTDAAETADPDAHPAVARALELARSSAEAEDPVPPTLGDLARAAGVSKVHLTRLFHDRFGVPPVEAVRLARLDRAAALLAGTMLPVQSVARSAGFADAFHFSRIFRATYGCPPSAYRQKAVAGERIPMTPLVRSRGLAGGRRGRT
jgi:AraC-like DNA-binding protein